MSHRHYCDFAGHPWECSNPSCECFDHNTSMEDGDHSRCSIELRACTKHEDEAARSIAEAMSQKPDPSFIEKFQERPHCECGCAETESRFVGFCLWCDHTYVKYDSRTEDLHFATHCLGAPKELSESARVRLA